MVFRGFCPHFGKRIENFVKNDVQVVTLPNQAAMNGMGRA